MDNQDIIDYATESAKLNDNKKNKPVDKPKKCMYVNCPMLASSSFDGNNRCSFHETGDYHNEVTIAIIANKHFIKAYADMVKWETDDWVKHKDWLETNKNLPMKEKEFPSIYLIRYFIWVSLKIKEEATRHIKNKTGG